MIDLLLCLNLLCQLQWFFQLQLSATMVLLLVVDYFSAFSTATDGASKRPRVMTIAR